MDKILSSTTTPALKEYSTFPKIQDWNRTNKMV